MIKALEEEMPMGQRSQLKVWRLSAAMVCVANKPRNRLYLATKGNHSEAKFWLRLHLNLKNKLTLIALPTMLP